MLELLTFLLSLFVLLLSTILSFIVLRERDHVLKVQNWIKTSDVGINWVKQDCKKVLESPPLSAILIAVSKGVKYDKLESK